MGLKPERLAAGAAFALDTVVFVYFLEQHPVHYPAAEGLFRRMEAGDISGVMSSLVFTELLVPAYRAGDVERAETLIHLLTHFPHLEVKPLSVEISAEAARLRAASGMRTPDAIHAATAMKAGASAIITNDKAFLRLSESIDILLLDV